MSRASSDIDGKELQTVRLPRSLLQEISASAQVAGRSIEDHLVQICLAGLAWKTILPSNAASQQQQDPIRRLAAVMRDPSGSHALQEVLRKNPARINFDPDDPRRAWMTCADGIIVQGQLTDSGEFIVDDSD